MSVDILKGRIAEIMKTTSIGQGVVSTSSKMVTDADGNQELEITPVVGDAYMDATSCEIIAAAIATAVVEYLTDYLQVVVPKAQAGGVTLYGTLEKRDGR